MTKSGGKTEIRDAYLNLDFYENVLSKEESAELLDYVEKNVPWRKKKTPGKRANQTFGDDGFEYPLEIRGKKSVIKVQPWTPEITKIKKLVESITGAEFTICVVQRYPNGRVGINPHRDKEMIKGTTIAGLSIGETRTLTMARGFKKHELELTPGSVYVFNPPTNDHWTHCIEKDGTIDIRVSFTLRTL